MEDLELDDIYISGKLNGYECAEMHTIFNWTDITKQDAKEIIHHLTHVFDMHVELYDIWPSEDKLAD